MIRIISAESKNGVIGKDNKLLWDVPEDMKRFRELTKGHPVVMGRKTYESIGRLLPKRENIILTRNEEYSVDGAIIFHDFKSCMKYISQKEEDVFVIGGEYIYKMFLPVADQIDLTTICEDYEGDAFFPEIDRENVWNTVEISMATSSKGPEYIFETLKFNSSRDWKTILEQLA